MTYFQSKYPQSVCRWSFQGSNFSISPIVFFREVPMKTAEKYWRNVKNAVFFFTVLRLVSQPSHTSP